MINKFIIQDFKSYNTADLYLSPLCVLVGANASGKSNALEALRLLSWLASGHKLADLQYIINKEDVIVRGFINHLPRLGTKKFILGCLVKDNNAEYKITIELALRKYKETWELFIENEICEKDNSWIYKINSLSKKNRNEMFLEFNNSKKGGRKPQIVISNQKLAFIQLTKASFKTEYKKIAKEILYATDIIERSLKKIVFLDPNPKYMHGYSFKSDKLIDESGRNLSASLHYLIDNDKDNKKEILNFIESFPEQNISDISFSETDRGEVLLKLHESFNNVDNVFDAGLLSDGTLRTLAIAARLLSAEEGSTVIIEEIDNGIHPNRIHKLLERIRSLAVSRKLSVIITTHNSNLLNSLSDDVVQDVQFCYRLPNYGYSKIVRIQDISDYPLLLAQDNLGNLLAKGLIDKYAKDITSRDEKIKKSLEWLKAFRDE